MNNPSLLTGLFLSPIKFIKDFPVASPIDSVAEKQHQPEEGEEGGRGTRDEPQVREVCEAFLRGLGAQVRTAEGGEAALSEMEHGEGGIDVVLLDVTMPGMDGRECMRRLRESDPELPVILMSGYSEGEVLGRQGDSQPNAFLQKPFGLTALAEAVSGV